MYEGVKQNDKRRLKVDQCALSLGPREKSKRHFFPFASSSLRCTRPPVTRLFHSVISLLSCFPRILVP